MGHLAARSINPTCRLGNSSTVNPIPHVPGTTPHFLVCYLMAFAISCSAVTQASNKFLPCMTNGKILST